MREKVERWEREGNEGLETKYSGEGEWTPVRHKRRFVQKNKWDNVRGDSVVDGGRSHDRKITSFFLCSFPESFRARDLYEVFSRFGAVNEVVIPAKRDVRGKRYGFVRFFDVKDSRLLGCKLDNIFLEDIKLQVNIPRFARSVSGLERKGDQVKDGRAGVV
ncbi:uncharacterized protein LOC131614521 [Vicia villosa]|uniref:uncharacterized protein LOC131614521 n=1 Tax=Vicia villosa TaxID=3911 RepID=UPI00273B6A71|nr:uncharacterized protein LOC131614521 [Vicia villosa]